jgi:hypothetical protein
MNTAVLHTTESSGTPVALAPPRPVDRLALRLGNALLRWVEHSRQSRELRVETERERAISLRERELLRQQLELEHKRWDSALLFRSIM